MARTATSGVRAETVAVATSSPTRACSPNQSPAVATRRVTIFQTPACQTRALPPPMMHRASQGFPSVMMFEP
eukprot:scaffold97_cov375-Prasinococcus_capsulatus_cf.AAC.7